MAVSRRRVALLSTLLALPIVAYGGIAVPHPAYASDQNQSSGSTIGVNKEDESGQRIWYGEESPEVTALADAAESMSQEHPDTVLGVVLTSDRQVVEVYVVSEDAEGVAALRGSAGDPERLRVIVNTNSPDQIDAAVKQVLEMDTDALGIEAVSPDPINDGIAVGLTDEYMLPESAGGRSEEEKQAALDALKSVSVPVRVFYEAAQEPAGTRANDSAPYFAGAQILRKIGEDELKSCSLGVPIELGGRYYSLTAGHCGTGRWENSSELVGNTYTTTWPTNSYRYGDWQLLRGSSYAMEVYDGDVSSSSSASIIDGFFGMRAAGRELCMSGAATGQTCRYVVRWVNGFRLLEGGIWVGQLTVVSHDGDRDGTSDCNGFDEGDSGGISHFTHGQGGQIAYGVVTGFNDSEGRCLYTVTQLSGLRAWDRDVRVG
ncbi:hypothetical protein ACSL103130_08770 [Actinomyces slackii]|uniref:Uncharacterized protein n=1 Tax=Actinomyces slackii TaxID=52774 RepID=A0A448KBK9_9ACTO|nr:hypothetical protein [Actinomyces slackii]VEG74329.1 Uncharacterised protein [Actinomyces slackii]